MNIELTKFFYNFIPGSIYLFLGVYIYCKISGENLVYLAGEKNEFVTGILFISFSLFLGYFLNVVWRLIREELNLDEKAKSKDSKLDSISLDEIRNSHAKLWYEGKEGLSEHFTSIASMWGNFFTGSLLITPFIFLLALINNCIFNKPISNICLVSFIAILNIIISIFSYYRFLDFRKYTFSAIARQMGLIKTNKITEELKEEIIDYIKKNVKFKNQKENLLLNKIKDSIVHIFCVKLIEEIFFNNTSESK